MGTAVWIDCGREERRGRGKDVPSDACKHGYIHSSIENTIIDYIIYICRLILNNHYHYCGWIPSEACKHGYIHSSFENTNIDLS